MLSTIIELLLGLTVAAAGAVGIGVATTSPHGIGPDADSIATKTEWARQHQADMRAARGEAAVLADVADPAAAGDGLDTALAAIERVMESAPDTATDGLQQAWDSVSSAGSAAEAGLERAPSDVPAGPPDDAPAGPPDGVPPVTPVQP